MIDHDSLKRTEQFDWVDRGLSGGGAINRRSFSTYSWSLFAYSLLRCLVDALSHCKQKSFNCKQKSSNSKYKAPKHNNCKDKRSIISRKLPTVNKKAALGVRVIWESAPVSGDWGGPFVDRAVALGDVWAQMNLIRKISPNLWRKNNFIARLCSVPTQVLYVTVLLFLMAGILPQYAFVKQHDIEVAVAQPWWWLRQQRFEDNMACLAAVRFQPWAPEYTHTTSCCARENSREHLSLSISCTRTRTQVSLKHVLACIHACMQSRACRRTYTHTHTHTHNSQIRSKLQRVFALK